MVKSDTFVNIGHICEVRNVCESLTCHNIPSLLSDKEKEEGRSRWQAWQNSSEKNPLWRRRQQRVLFDSFPQQQWIWSTYRPSTFDTWKNDIRLRSIILPRRRPRWKAVKIYRVLPTPILMSCFAVSSFDRSDFKNLKFNMILFSAKSYLWM